MAEPTTTTTAALTAGTIGLTSLAMIGIDVPSLIAALLGCVVIQTLMPSEEPRIGRIFVVTIGSMIFASFGTPWLSPVLAKMAPASMAPEHIKACSAALLAAFPKPALLYVKAKLLQFTEKRNGVV